MTTNDKMMEENYTLAKWLAGELSGDELRAFEQTPGFETYQKIATYSSQLQTPAFDEQKIYRNIMSSKEKTGRVIAFYQSQWFRIAAILLLFAGLTFFYTTNIAVRQYAGNGESSSFFLPDQSQVVLNSGSEIKFNKWNWSNSRKLHLAGEAYFKVSKGKKFEVNTPLGTVTVLGTQFNVKVRENRFDVTCYEGRVRVDYQDQHVVITKGSRVLFADGELINSSTVSVTKPEWTTGELTFTQEYLEDILEELERHYNCTIIHDNISNSQLFTGTLPGDNIDKGLEILSSIYHLKYTKDSNKKITLAFVNVEE